MIPFIDLTRDKDDMKLIKTRINRILDKGHYILGNEVKSFEDEFAGFTGHKHAIGVGSGTDALAMIFKSVNAGTTGICAAAPLPCGQAARIAGSDIVFIDSRPDNSGLLSIEDLESNADKIDTLLAVHLYGTPEYMDTVNEICRDNDITVIEDCSQSAGTYINGKHTGGFSIASAFSFYPTKNLGAMGDAGMIVTDSSRLAEEYSKMRNYGQSDIYAGEMFGVNSRLDELQASVLNVRLKSIETKNSRRRSIAEYYSKHIDNELITLPPERYFQYGNMHIFPLFTEKREDLKQYLTANNIGYSVHYPVPLSEQKAFSNYHRHCPNAKRLSSSELSIPIFPDLTDSEVKTIVNVLNGFSDECR
ncbi:MAG: DegT/DnrJ/EryC1/StrS family aminotransferase [bacterium]